MSYAGFLGGANAVPYAPAMDPNAAKREELEKRQRYVSSPDYEREMFERGLQTQEQQRRAYDSETARQSQQQKYGVLSGLVGRMGGGSRMQFG